jgi:hypothetical protein
MPATNASCDTPHRRFLPLAAIALLVACTNLRESPPPVADLDAAPADASDPPVDSSAPTDAAQPKPDAASADAGPLRQVRVLATNQPKIFGLYGDPQDIFFTVEGGDASVRAFKRTTTTVRNVASFNINEGHNPFIGEIGALGGGLAWTNFSSGLFTINKDGTNRLRAVTGEAPEPLATDGSTAYFTQKGTEYPLVAFTVGDARPAMLHKYVISPLSIALDSTHVYWSERGPLAASGGGVKRKARNALVTAPLDKLYDGGPDWAGAGITLSSTDVYFAEPARRRVAKVSKVGGPALVVADSLAYPIVVRIFGAYLYILDAGANRNDGAVYQVPIAGGSAIKIASGLGQPQGMLVEDKDIFVACTGSGELVAITR